MTNDTTIGDAAGLQFIQPLSVSMTIDGVDLTITPLVLRELPNLLALTLPVFSSLRTAGDGFIERLKNGKLSNEEVSSLLTSLAVNGDEYVGILALCSRQPAAWVGGLLFDRAVELAMVCLQVNADFFQRAMPYLRHMASRGAAGPAAAGGAPSEAAASATPTPSPS